MERHIRMHTNIGICVMSYMTAVVILFVDDPYYIYIHIYIHIYNVVCAYVVHSMY